MTGGRTTWYATDAAEHDRELNVELGEEYGPAGPYVIRVLKDLAQQQRDSGNVRTGYRSLARKAFCSVDVVKQIVATAAEIGALDDFQDEPDGRRFKCRISGWEADQARGKSSFKKAAQRATEEPDLDVTDRDAVTAEGDEVTEKGDKSPSGSPTIHNQGTSTATSSELDESRTARDLFAYWQDQCGHPQAKPTRDRLSKVRARLREGYTPAQIRLAIDGAARAAFVNPDGKRFDDLELICRNGSKLESFIEKASLAAGNGRLTSDADQHAALAAFAARARGEDA